MGLKAAVQALKKAEELKAKVSRHNDLLNNSEVWSDHQQLQTVYHQVLVLDLEYALDKKVEQELWTLGFKNHIAALQHLSRDKKNPRRSECQALLSWCLEAASGFYLTLLQELCSAFELDLPFRRRGAVYGQSKTWSNSEQLTQPHKSSCLYICQYCLVHLGDIARYRSQRKQAESFYRHAILLSPSSGQPYNQLALLEASRGDKLATVFHYVRSIAVKHPFPAAATNLSNTLSAVVDAADEPLLEVHAKLSLQDYVSLFLHVHGLLHVAVEHEQAALGVRSLNATLTALVATRAFSATRLTQMTAVNLYALRHATDTAGANNKQLSEDELQVKGKALDLLAGAFSAYLLPIYTMSADESLLDYCALPAIKLTMDWIKTDPKVLKESVFIKRLQIWPSLCKLLNSLQSIVGDFEHKNSDKIPLPEDRDLQCFLPLANAFKDLDFTSENLNQDVTFFNKLRVTRLVNLGLWLTSQTVDNNVLITAKKGKSLNSVVFEPANKQPDPTTELLEELKHFSIKNNTSASTSSKEMKKSPNKGGEKQRGGILKPQGSLEKSREEREQALLLAAEASETCSTTSLSNSSLGSVRSDTSSKLKRNRQNVAMQAIAKKVEENNKQVTFLTEPTPTTTNKPTKPIDKPPIKTNSEPLLPLPSSIEPIRMPQQIIPPLLAANDLPNIKPLPFNQTQNLGHISRNMPPFSFQNNTPNLPFHNSLPPTYQRQQTNLNGPFNTSPNNQINPQNQGFNVPFDLTSPQPQPVGYQHQPVQNKDQFSQFSPWMRDDKLPMPPSTWWTNNQKTLPRTFTSTTAQNDLFSPNNYSYNLNNVSSTANSVGYLPEGLGFDRGYNPPPAPGPAPGIYNNMSVWNSGAVQPNLHQLLMNQTTQSMINSTPQSNQFGDLTKVANMPPRENHSMPMRDTNDTQTNSPVPGYSLFNSNWAPNLTVHGALKSSPPGPGAERPPLMRQQSLFSGPGPSPLERLLEQQKQLRGPNKEDT